MAQQQLSNVAAIAVTVGAIGVVGTILGFVYLFGPGHVFVVAPREVDLDVSVDGGKAQHVRAGGHLLLDLGQGKRSVHFAPTDGTPVDVTVDVPSGFGNQLAMLPGTCFAEVDVTDSHYGRGDGRPELIAIHQAPGAVLTGVPVFRVSELPEHISENVRQTLVSEVPCDVTTPGDVFRSLKL